MDRSGYVYLISSGNSIYKIGKTVDVNHRLYQLRSEYRDNLIFGIIYLTNPRFFAMIRSSKREGFEHG